MANHTLDIESVTHLFGSLTAVDNVSLSVGAGEIVALLGPSGCGKTTLLRIVAGFVVQKFGAIRIDGVQIDDLQPNNRNIGIVFQNYALFPHLTVGENVAYGLQARRVDRSAVKKKVAQCLEIVQLPHIAERFPRQLSGGQQQRVALARVIATEPSILLLDEPFGALDKNLRLDMQLEIKRLQRQLGLTAIMVTHDQEEAMSIADRIAVMNCGHVEQLGTPTEVYDQPATPFVNSFIGSTNLLPGVVRGSNSGVNAIELDAGAEIKIVTNTQFELGAKVIVSARPEHLMLTSEPSPCAWPVDIGLTLPLGPTLVIEAWTKHRSALKVTMPRLGHQPQKGAVWCALRKDALPSVFPQYPT
ncbi:MAG: Fe3+/spermidine/putrescine ABC transporter ATP-binding protein [Alcaligenaceae bacterium]|nr:MAG: Fe3+/spermidine/putrescine ABC transporter ATP-binding protein [Alcaligenaceae bacterium]